MSKLLDKINDLLQNESISEIELSADEFNQYVNEVKDLPIYKSIDEDCPSINVNSKRDVKIKVRNDTNS